MNTRTCLVSLGLIACGIAQAQDDERVPYPSGYRTWAVALTNVVGPQSRLFAVRGGFHHVYANAKAVDGYRTGSFPEGSVIVDEGVYARESDGITREGELRSVEVMNKDSLRYRATGGWGYERFDGSKQVAETTLEVRTACYSCHAAKKDTDYVSTTFRLLASPARPPQPTLKVGVAQRAFVPAKPYLWRGAKTQALLTTIWYPADAAAVEQLQWVGPPDAPLFGAGRATAGATPATGKFPLVVLSHGTGGSALNLGWLGCALAAHGYIAAAVNHPGNNALEPYTLEGFSLWWERATDLSEVIDQMLADSEFGVHIDPARIGAAGFSLGGYTMIELAGGISERSAFQDFCKSSAADGICQSPPEFPDLLKQFNALDEATLRGERNSHRDSRVHAVFAIAPALGPAFRPATLKSIAVPVQIVAGSADDNVPVGSGAKYLASHIPGSKLVLLDGGVRHYEFLGTCTAQGRQRLPLLCTDNPGVDRAAIQDKTAGMAVRFFDIHLGKGR